MESDNSTANPSHGFATTYISKALHRQAAIFPEDRLRLYRGSCDIPGGRIPTGGVVYVVEHPWTKCVKVGISRAPKTRITGLESAVGCDFSCIYISRTVPDPKEIEYAVHRHFRSRRVKGEWFKVEWQKAADKTDAMASPSGIWALHNQWPK